MHQCDPCAPGAGCRGGSGSRTRRWPPPCRPGRRPPPAPPAPPRRRRPPPPPRPPTALTRPAILTRDCAHVTPCRPLSSARQHTENRKAGIARRAERELRPREQVRGGCARAILAHRHAAAHPRARRQPHALQRGRRGRHLRRARLVCRHALIAHLREALLVRVCSSCMHVMQTLSRESVNMFETHALQTLLFPSTSRRRTPNFNRRTLISTTLH